jgi:hypothetical protein
MFKLSKLMEPVCVCSSARKVAMPARPNPNGNFLFVIVWIVRQGVTIVYASVNMSFSSIKGPVW